jgi:hypothetical protein
VQPRPHAGGHLFLHLHRHLQVGYAQVTPALMSRHLCAEVVPTQGRTMPCITLYMYAQLAASIEMRPGR